MQPPLLVQSGYGPDNGRKMKVMLKYVLHVAYLIKLIDHFCPWSESCLTILYCQIAPFWSLTTQKQADHSES